MNQYTIDLRKYQHDHLMSRKAQHVAEILRDQANKNSTPFIDQSFLEDAARKFDAVIDENDFQEALAYLLDWSESSISDNQEHTKALVIWE